MPNEQPRIETRTCGARAAFDSSRMPPAPQAPHTGSDYFEDGVYHLHLPMTDRLPTRGELQRVPRRVDASRDGQLGVPPSDFRHHVSGSRAQASSSSPPPAPLGPSRAVAPEGDMALLSDIQRTAELVREFKRLKAQGGTHEERRALQRRVKALRAEHEARLQASSASPSAPLAIPPPRSPSRTEPSPGTVAALVPPTSAQHVDPSVFFSAPVVPPPRKATPPPPRTLPDYRTGEVIDTEASVEAALAREAQARVQRSVCFAVVLAESHVRQTIRHKWERRWLKMKAACAEERTRIALSAAVLTPRPSSTEAPVGARLDVPVRPVSYSDAPVRPTQDSQAPTIAIPHDDVPLMTSTMCEEEAAARSRLTTEERTARRSCLLDAQDERRAVVAVANARTGLVHDEREARAALAVDEAAARSHHTHEAAAAREAVLRAEQEAQATAAAAAAAQRQRDDEARRQTLEEEQRAGRRDVEEEEDAARVAHAAALASTVTALAQKEDTVATEATSRRALCREEEAARDALADDHAQAHTAAREREGRRLAAARMAKEQEEQEEKERMYQQQQQQQRAEELARRQHLLLSLDAVSHDLVADATCAAAAQHDAVRRQKEEAAQRQRQDAAEAEARELTRREAEKAAEEDAARTAWLRQHNADCAHAQAGLSRAEDEQRHALEAASVSDMDHLFTTMRNTIAQEELVGVAEPAARSALDGDEALQRVALLNHAVSEKAHAEATTREREEREQGAARATVAAAHAVALRAAVFATSDTVVEEAVKEAASQHTMDVQRAQAKSLQDERERAAAAAAAANAEREAAEEAHREAVEACFSHEQSSRDDLVADEAEARARWADEVHDRLAQILAAEDDARRVQQLQEEARAAQAAAAEVTAEKREVAEELDDLACHWIVEWVLTARTDAASEVTALSAEAPHESSAPTQNHKAVTLDDSSLAELSSAHVRSDDGEGEEDSVGDVDVGAQSTSSDRPAQTPDAPSTDLPPPPRSTSPRVVFDCCDALFSEFLAEAATTAATTASLSHDAPTPAVKPVTPSLTVKVSHEGGGDSDSTDTDSDDSIGSERSFETMSPKAAGATVNVSMAASPRFSPQRTPSDSPLPPHAASVSPAASSSSSDSVFEFPAVEKAPPSLAGREVRRRSGEAPPLVSPRADSGDRDESHAANTWPQTNPATLAVFAEALAHQFVVDAARIHQQRTADPSVPACASPRGGGARPGEAAFLLLDPDVAQAVADFVVTEAGAVLKAAIADGSVSHRAPTAPPSRQGQRGLQEVTEGAFAPPLFRGMEQAVLAANRALVEAGSPGALATTQLPEDWRTALLALADRLDADAFQYVAQRYLRLVEDLGLRGDKLYLDEELEQVVYGSVDVVEVFGHHVSPHDCRYLALYYLECARRGADVVDPVVAHSQHVLRENLFRRPAEGCVVGAPTTGAATSATSRQCPATPRGARATRVLAPTMHVRRAGLTQVVLEHALENVMQDILLDTAAWVASIL